MDSPMSPMPDACSTSSEGFDESANVDWLATQFTELTITEADPSSSACSINAPIASNLESLPTEILQQISSHLSLPDVSSLRLVSRACLRVDVRCLVHTLAFSVTLSGLAKLRAICSHRKLSPYVRKLEFCTHWMGNLGFEHDNIDIINSHQQDHRLIIDKMLRHGSLSSAHAKMTAVKAVTDAMDRVNKAVPWSLNRLSNDLIDAYIHDSIPMFRFLQSLTIYENGISLEWNMNNRISINQLIPKVRYPFYRSFDWPVLAEKILATLAVSTQHAVVDCDITWHNFDLLDEGSGTYRRKFPKCFGALDGHLKRVLITFLDLNPDTDIIERREGDMVKDWSEYSVTNKARCSLLNSIVSYIPNVEDLEVVFGYKKASLLQPQSARRTSMSVDHLCNYMYIEQPMRTLHASGLCRLRIEAAALSQRDFTDFLTQNRGTLRDLTLSSIEWVQDASLLLWIRSLRRILKNMEAVKFEGVHKEIGARRYINMDGIFPRWKDMGTAESDERANGGRCTVGERLGEICLARVPFNSNLRYVVLAWLGKALCATAEQHTEWIWTKKRLNLP